jgi:hypothetical protein
MTKKLDTFKLKAPIIFFSWEWLVLSELSPDLDEPGAGFWYCRKSFTCRPCYGTFGFFLTERTEGLNPQEAVMVVESVCQNRHGVHLAWNFFKAALWSRNNLFRIRSFRKIDPVSTIDKTSLE